MQAGSSAGGSSGRLNELVVELRLTGWLDGSQNEGTSRGIKRHPPWASRKVFGEGRWAYKGRYDAVSQGVVAPPDAGSLRGAVWKGGEMQDATGETAPRWASSLGAFNVYMTQDLIGGPRRIKLAWAINLHKILTPAVVVLLMLWFRNFGLAAWVYLALHGTYCLCWLMKHAAFRDPKWETRVTFPGAGFTFALLATYWVAPFLLISDVLQRPPNELTGCLLALSISLLVLGTSIMMTSDCQKRFTLKYHAGLITGGMFKRIRHPNYLGEMMVYASLALLVRHWIPWAVLAYWWLCVFLVNMLTIEASLSRYPEWEEYRRKTSMLIPWVV